MTRVLIFPIFMDTPEYGTVRGLNSLAIIFGNCYGPGS